MKEVGKSKTLLPLVIVLSILLLGLVAWMIYDKLNNKDLDPSKSNNTSNYLSLKDFPLKDDMAEDNSYIKYKGLLSFMANAKLDNNKRTLTATYENLNFALESVETECIMGGENGFLESQSLSLKVNDNIIYNSSNGNYPYLIITDKHLIIRNENVEHYDDEGYEDNLEQLGTIYIYDMNLKKVLEINKVNTHYLTNEYDKLNSSLDFAIKNNVLYYVVSNGKTRILKCVDLNAEKIIEKEIESFDSSNTIIRNKNINSINQFPYKATFDIPNNINGYDVNINYDNDIITISKSNKELKKINIVSWYVNPNGFNNADLLGDNSANYYSENKLYYLLNNKNNTLSLIVIDFNNELKETVLETFIYYDDNNSNFNMILDDCYE